MTIFNIFRTLAVYIYIFGYILLHYNVLRKGEKALAENDRATLQAVVRKYIPIWCGGVLRLSGVKYTVEGRENIPKGSACVFVGNHRSYFDIPLMLVCLDEPHGVLSKKQLGKIPLLSRWMKLLGCVYVDREDVRASVQALNEAAQVVQSGRSFTIFPEGTRYTGEEGRTGEFKNGAFRIAIKTGAPVVPVAILGSRDLYENHHHIITPGTVRVQILKPIQTTGMTKAEQKQLPQAVRQAIMARLEAHE